MRLFKLCLIAPLMMACNPVAELDDPVPKDIRDQAYPALIRTDAFVAPKASETTLADQRDELGARAAALQSRAESLGGDIDEDTRTQLEGGIDGS